MHGDMKQIEEYADNVNRYLLCLSHNEDIAEELTQETMYRGIMHINQLKDPSKIEMWLCKIAKNLWYQELNQRKRYEYEEYDEEIINNIPTEQDIEQDLIDKDNCEKLKKEIDKLPDIEREILYLRLEEDMKFKDIGKIFGNTENWARTTFFRTKQKLAKEVKENEQETTM